MTLEAKSTSDNTDFIVGGSGKFKDNKTVEQDAARGTADMVRYTVMVKDATTPKLKPMTVLNDATSESNPTGLLMTTIDAASIVAGDVNGQKLLIGGEIEVDEDKIVLEGGLTLESLILVPIGAQRTIRQALQDIGIYPTTTYTNGLIAPVVP